MAHRIMAVDDSDIAQDFIRAALSDIGFDDIISFLDPAKALEAITTGEARPDLILLDIMMPEIDGIELCARIRGIDDWNDVPIIMLTSRTDMDSLSQAFMAGANDYVTKPFNRIELQARMRSCLRLKSELDRRRAGEGRQRLRDSTTARAELTDLLGNRTGFQASLLALPDRAHDRLGLAVFRIDGLAAAADPSPAQRAEIHAAVAQLLGQVPLPARDQFAHWEGNLFCLAILDTSEAALRDKAEEFTRAVTGASVTFREGWAQMPLSLSAFLIRPRDITPAAALVRAIAAAEKTDRTGIHQLSATDGTG